MRRPQIVGNSGNAVTAAGSTGITIQKPDGARPGDLIFAFLNSTTTTMTGGLWSVPVGTFGTTVDNGAMTGGNDRQRGVFCHTVVGNEPPEFTFTSSITATSNITGILVLVRGGENADVAAVIANGTNDATPAALAITPVSPYVLVFQALGLSSNAAVAAKTGGAPANYTLLDYRSQVDGSVFGNHLAVAYQEQTDPTATGTDAWTTTADDATSEWWTVSVAVKTALLAPLPLGTWIPVLASTDAAGATVTGVAVGAATSSGTATGLVTRYGVAAGASTASGTATGLVTRYGVAAGASVASGTATGLRTVLGTAAGASTASGVATGLRTVFASSAGAATSSGTATGLRTILATGAGAGTGTGSATGLRTVYATGAGAGTGTGSASGLRTIYGTAAGADTASGVAIAVRMVLATAAGTATSVGVAVGAPGVAVADDPTHYATYREHTTLEYREPTTARYRERVHALTHRENTTERYREHTTARHQER